MIGGTCIAILTSVFPGAERGRALGINVASTYVGLSLGPFLGGVLTQHLGWRSIFYLTGILALVVAVLIFWKLRGEWADARGERFDYTGSVVFGVSLVVLLYGFTMLPEVLGIVLVVAGLLGLVGFGWWEGKVASPVFDVRLFRKNLTFIFSNLATMINYVAVYAVSFLLSLYLQDVKGISPQNAGLVLLVQPALQAVFSPLAGRLSDRMMPRKIASVGMALTAVSLVMFVFLDGDSGLWLVVASLAVLGLGIAFFASPNTNAIMGSVDKRFFGIASGSLAMMRTVGMALGMGITMILFAHYIGAAEIKPPYFPAFLTSMRVGFIIYAALCLIGVFFQLVTGGMKKGVADGKSVLG
jgi:MFS family permease